jgi:hypothetical protein
MPPFEVHDERPARNGDAFIDGVLPIIERRLRAQLGRFPSGSVHVVLSTREQHERRFPARLAHLEPLVDHDEVDALDDPAAELNRRFPRRLYAHAIATRIGVELAPPQGAAVDCPGVFLDMETIFDLAADLAVPAEAMLLKTLSHELSHIVREHAVGPPTPTHGWMAEGDAQRDAWGLLTDLLGDPAWTAVAWTARAAQLRLADLQPAAYRQFPASSGDRIALAAGKPLPEGRWWQMAAPREVFRLANEGRTEVPFFPAYRAVERLDVVVLRDRDRIVGPWIVSDVRPQPRMGHPDDIAAVERELKSISYRSPPRPSWLQLRPLGTLRVADAIDTAPSQWWPSEMPRSCNDRLAEDADGWVRERAEAATDEQREVHEEMRRLGHEPPAAPFDPFDDWRGRRPGRRAGY